MLGLRIWQGLGRASRILISEIGRTPSMPRVRLGDGGGGRSCSLPLGFTIIFYRWATLSVGKMALHKDANCTCIEKSSFKLAVLAEGILPTDRK